MKNLKIAFFGTSDRSKPILEALKNNFDLALCVTRTDAKVGRKQELKETYVKTWCKQNSIPYREIDGFKNAELDILPEIELAVVADFSFIIPQNIISKFKHGMINIHFSLLPKGRGASPVQHTLLAGDTQTGITFYLMDKGMDTGDVIKQIEYKLADNESSGELYDMLFKIAAENLSDILGKYMDGTYKPISQDHTLATYTHSPSHPKNTFIYKEDAKLDLTREDVYLERCTRAYNPWPIAWTTLGELSQKYAFKPKHTMPLNSTVKIYKAHLRDTRLVIDQLQPQNSKQMTWEAFLNGYSEG